MSLKQPLLTVTVLALFGNIFIVGAQSQPPRPNLSGKWTLIEGGLGGSSPLGNEGSITQDVSAVIFGSLKVPFDGATTTTQDRAYVWQYEGRWVGLAFVVSMKASSGRTPADFTDLMVVSPTSADTMTMVLMRTTMGGTMTTSTLKYRKS